MVILQPLPTYSGCTTGEFSEIWCQTVMQWMRCLFVLPTPCMQESKEWQKFKKKRSWIQMGNPEPYIIPKTLPSEMGLYHIRRWSLEAVGRSTAAGPGCTTCTWVHEMLGYQNPTKIATASDRMGPTGQHSSQNPSPAFFELLQKDQTQTLTIGSSFYNSKKNNLEEPGFLKGGFCMLGAGRSHTLPQLFSGRYPHGANKGQGWPSSLVALTCKRYKLIAR